MIAIKEQAIRLIKTLPGDATLEDIQYHLYVREKVQRGIQAADNGQIVTQQTAEKKVRQWLMA
jgi:predicted transcriptional regulator